MSSGRYMGIPREKIPWFPVIDADKCTSCGACLEFCSNNVFDQGDTAMEVVQPFNCVVGCKACEQECPVGALTFPTNEELIKSLRELREEHSPT